MITALIITNLIANIGVISFYSFLIYSNIKAQKQKQKKSNQSQNKR